MLLHTASIILGMPFACKGVKSISNKQNTKPEYMGAPAVCKKNNAGMLPSTVCVMLNVLKEILPAPVPMPGLYTLLVLSVPYLKESIYPGKRFSHDVRIKRDAASLSLNSPPTSSPSTDFTLLQSFRPAKMVLNRVENAQFLFPRSRPGGAALAVAEDVQAETPRMDHLDSWKSFFSPGHLRYSGQGTVACSQLIETARKLICLIESTTGLCFLFAVRPSCFGSDLGALFVFFNSLLSLKSFCCLPSSKIWEAWITQSLASSGSIPIPRARKCGSSRPPSNSPSVTSSKTTPRCTITLAPSERSSGATASRSSRLCTAHPQGMILKSPVLMKVRPCFHHPNGLVV